MVEVGKLSIAEAVASRKHFPFGVSASNDSNSRYAIRTGSHRDRAPAVGSGEGVTLDFATLDLSVWKPDHAGVAGVAGALKRGVNRKVIVW